MTDEWWPEGYDDPAFQVQRQVYGTAIGGDYVRGSTVEGLANTAVRYTTEASTLSTVGTRSILHVAPVLHDTVRIEWGWPAAPNDQWLEMSIVRSAFGRPSTPNDGQTIYIKPYSEFVNPLYPSADGKAKPLINPPIVLDQALPPGRWYHYAMFFKVSPIEWVRGMVDSCLLPRDLQHDEYLWNNVPPYYRWVDGESGQQVGFLRQFLNVFGFELDQAREFIESWQHLYDIDYSPIRLLRQLGPNFGIPYESGVGDIRYRSLMAHIGHLYETRGTRPSLEMLVSNMSKYQTTLGAGESMMLTPDDSDFYTSTGNWAGLHPETVIAGQTLLTPDKVFLDVIAPGEVTPPEGRGAMKIWTASADATGKILVTVGDGIRYPGNDANANNRLEILPKQYGIPAQAGVSYGFSFQVKLTTAPTTVEGCLLFFDTDGMPTGMLGIQRSDPVGLVDTNWHEFYVKGQAPAGTVFVVPGILFTSRPASGVAIPIYVAASMVYVAGGAGEALVLPPDRYLTMGDPGEVLGGPDGSHPDPFLLGSSRAAISGGGVGTTGISVFTDFFRQQLFANLGLMTGKQIEIFYFSRYAAFTDANDPRYTTVRRVADLANVLGWGAPLGPTETHTVSTTDVGNNRYVIDSAPFDNLGGWPDTNVVAAAVVLKGSYGGTTDPIIFLTDSPFAGGTVMRQDDSLVVLPAANISNLAWLFGWQTPAVGATQVLPTAGALSVLKAPPDYEYSHQQHAWLYPQRVNMLANPSFELGTGHWRSNGALTRVAGGAPGGGVWEAHLTGTPNLVLESNVFPTKGIALSSNNWTIQAMIRGTGRVRIGLVSWEPDYASTNADWGPDTEIWDLPANGWLHVYALRRVGEGTTAMVRIECDGGSMNLDNLLCEPEWLSGWPYFDGDTTYGALDDYSWYGGENRKGATYSLWYNHRRAVVGRLFAWNISDDDFTVTDEEIESQGYVYKWVPAGVRVIPHMDVLSVDDPQSPIPAVSGTVIPYDGGTGVRYPWPPKALSFPGTAGNYVSTPDAAAFDITGDLCIIAKVTPTNWLGIGSIVSKWSGTQCSYQMYLAGPSGGSGTLGLMYSTNGSTLTEFRQSISGFSNTATPWVAVTLDVDNGNDASVTKFWSSLDGVTWKQMGDAFNGSLGNIFPSTTPINIGANTGGTAALFNGLIQDVRIYNGIGANTAPGQGTLVGHFDASRTWPGATYTDETGKVWTRNGSLSFVSQS